MATLWNIGIDWGIDPTGNTPLAGYYFLDKANGSDLNAGTPSAPWQTLAHAEANTPVDDSLVIAKGDYSIGGRTMNRLMYYANSQWETSLNGGNLSSSFANGELYGFKIRNFTTNPWRQVNNVYYNNCIFVDANIFENQAGGDPRGADGCVFINSSVNNNRRAPKAWRRCIFINSPFTVNHDTGMGIVQDCSFDSNSPINTTYTIGAGDVLTFERCNINGGITDNIDATVRIDNGSVPFSLQGIADRVQFLSPLQDNAIGFNGYSSGGIKTGFTLKSDTTGYGVAPLSNSGVTFGASGEIGLTNAFDVIETTVLSFDQVRKSPTIDITGLVDIIYSDTDPTMDIPNPNIYEMRYSPTSGGGLSAYKRFQFGLRPSLDNMGRSNAEANFNANDPKTYIDIYDYQCKFTYR